jgi:hypothetical protein
MFVSCDFVHYLVCRSVPLDTLMIFTTTISVSNIYSTSSSVMVSIIWLYISVVVVVISFSIIVSCIFISLLLFTVGIMYDRADSSVNVRVVNISSLDSLNISLDANLFLP